MNQEFNTTPFVKLENPKAHLDEMRRKMKGKPGFWEYVTGRSFAQIKQSIYNTIVKRGIPEYTPPPPVPKRVIDVWQRVSFTTSNGATFILEITCNSDYAAAIIQGNPQIKDPGQMVEKINREATYEACRLERKPERPVTAWVNRNFNWLLLTQLGFLILISVVERYEPGIARTIAWVNITAVLIMHAKTNAER